MSSYVLGHTARERDRLDLQGQLYNAATRRAFEDAGICAGMRVLDVGCGSGDVTRLVSQLVGPTGAVHGIDRDHATILDARRRLASESCNNVTFGVSEMGADLDLDPFDALVGRFVLMHQPNPAETLSRTVRFVQSDGVVVFLESHMLGLRKGVHSHPRSQAYDEIVQWKCRVVAAAGADIGAGFRMREVFQRAGLPDPTMRMEAPVVGGIHTDYYRYVEESVRSMLPQAQSLGINDFDDDRVNRIEHDLRHDVVSQDGVLVVWPIVAAWCRKP